MMSVMSAQLPLPVALVAGAVSIGEAVSLVEDGDGGRVFLRGELVYAWSVGDVALRRLAAVQLVANKAARVADVAGAFGVDAGTLWRWGQQLSATGVGGLVPDKRGPKGAHRLTAEVVADIIARRAAGASYRAIAAAVGVSSTSVRRVSEPATSARAAGNGSEHDDEHDTGRDSAAETIDDSDPVVADLPVLPPAADRSAERPAARWGQLTYAEPVFAPAARVPLAGLLLAIPALEATGLLSCAT
jgi:Helix-turn-helix domain